ncbi:hypothetical protein BJX70DRAFT_362449 [Aspergillus crustosus]
MHLQQVATLALAMGASAFPVAQDDSNVCSLNPFDKGTWWDSGARTYLDKWFKDHNGDEHNWLYKMDAETTADGQGNSVLDCTNIEGQGTCGGPEVQCRFFTPKSYFYIRQMAAQFNQYMTWAHELLQDYAISETLGMDALVDDLNVYVADETAIDNMLRSFAAAFSIGDKISKQGNGVIGDFFGIFGGITAIAAANNTPDEPSVADLKKAVEAWLGKYFWAVRDSITKITNRMFGGNQLDSGSDILDGLIEQFQALGIPTDGDSKISKILSSGAFLEQISQSDIAAGINAGFTQIKHHLIGVLFQTSHVFVKGVRMNEPDKYCQSYGDRNINGWCYRLFYLDGNTQKPVDDGIMEKLEFTYHVDPTAFYTNILRCKNNFDSAPENINPGADEWGYSPCFFPINLVEYWEVDCMGSDQGAWPDYYKKWFEDATGGHNQVGPVYCRDGAS